MSTDTNLCSPLLHRFPSHLHSRRTCGYRRCWCMFACCGTRHCLPGIRSRLRDDVRALVYDTRETAHTPKKSKVGLPTISPREPAQPVAPSFVQPDAQSSHVRAPSVFVHVRSLWHPPLFVRHSFTSTQVVASIRLLVSTKTDLPLSEQNWLK